MNSKSQIYLPIILAFSVAIGFLLGTQMNRSNMHIPFSTFGIREFNKLNEVINYIENEYVDTVNEKTLVEATINTILSNMDPHSAYIPAEDLQAVNEPLEGNFDGIGIEFHIQNDTIMVVAPVSGGPAELLGIKPGDKIIKIEDINVAGIGITNNEVMQKLRGSSGTKVSISVLKKGFSKLFNYTITRGKIPIYSIDVSYMVNDSTGYIKISRFASSTHQEFINAFNKLQSEGLKNLVLDLRGNPGGFLNAAITISDEFLENKRKIVYTMGKSKPKEIYKATSKGSFEKGNLAVLIDEGSASASEIVAGALQDWDRATIIGRRSFGKGLVQEQMILPDGSAVRLTVARYYTPTGRSIQKSYDSGIKEYYEELTKRYTHGELQNSDSIYKIDSLKYTTPGGRIVYGGGGIIPDIFVPIDTSGNSNFLTEVLKKGLINKYALTYVDINRQKLHSYESFENFKQRFMITDEIYSDFLKAAQKEGVYTDEQKVKPSSKIIKVQLKAFIARQQWKNEGFYPIIHSIDNTFNKAMEIVEMKE